MKHKKLVACLTSSCAISESFGFSTKDNTLMAASKWPISKVGKSTVNQESQAASGILPSNI